MRKGVVGRDNVRWKLASIKGKPWTLELVMLRS